MRQAPALGASSARTRPPQATVRAGPERRRPGICPFLRDLGQVPRPLAPVSPRPCPLPPAPPARARAALRVSFGPITLRHRANRRCLPCPPGARPADLPRQEETLQGRIRPRRKPDPAGGAAVAGHRPGGSEPRARVGGYCPRPGMKGPGNQEASLEALRPGSLGRGRSFELEEAGVQGGRRNKQPREDAGKLLSRPCQEASSQDGGAADTALSRRKLKEGSIAVPALQCSEPCRLRGSSRRLTV